MTWSFPWFLILPHQGGPSHHAHHIPLSMEAAPSTHRSLPQGSA